MAMMRRRTLTSAVIGVAALALAVFVPAASSFGATTPSVYVALGDSYTAGPLIIPQSDPLTCVRSSNNYPGLLARALKVTTFRDASCSGSTTSNFTAPQKGIISGTAAPEYNSLSTDTTLVTVGIGGNDIGIVGLAEGCLNVLPAPFGKSCAATYTAGGGDVYAAKVAAFAPTFGTVIAAIRARAPHATIVMVGYPTAIRPGGCFPIQPLLGPDATYVQKTINELNAAMKAEALSHGALYADLATSSVGHDACALPGNRWVEGLIPLSDAAPLHPNILEMRNAERVIAGDLAGS